MQEEEQDAARRAQLDRAAEEARRQMSLEYEAQLPEVGTMRGGEPVELLPRRPLPPWRSGPSLTMEQWLQAAKKEAEERKKAEMEAQKKQTDDRALIVEALVLGVQTRLEQGERDMMGREEVDCADGGSLAQGQLREAVGQLREAEAQKKAAKELLEAAEKVRQDNIQREQSIARRERDFLVLLAELDEARKKRDEEKAADEAALKKQRG